MKFVADGMDGNVDGVPVKLAEPNLACIVGNRLSKAVVPL